MTGAAPRGSFRRGAGNTLYYLAIKKEKNTMSYDFTTIIDRSACGSSKWEGMRKIDPDVGPDVLPMSTADMEFLTDVLP